MARSPPVSPPAEALAAIRAGLSPEEAFLFDALGEPEPTDVLRERYAVRFGLPLTSGALRSRLRRMEERMQELLASHRGER